MPESVTDRCTKAHEYIFLLSKAERYYYDANAVKEPSRKPSGVSTLVSSERKVGTLRNDGGRIHVSDGTRNRRSVWTVSTRPFKEAHFATYPPKLIEPCILAGSREGDTVLDPFNGAGTTGLVSYQHGREYIGIELNPDYAEIAKRRIEHERQQTPLLEAIR
jgi:DNA modification methylase